MTFELHCFPTYLVPFAFVEDIEFVKSWDVKLILFYFPGSYLKSAAVPMWAVYQFLISVVLLRILIVMMTITYRKIYDDLENQWK